ncbi:hypothetical protein NHG32_02020 [Aerococcaceae bacterium NML191219]|nr:hypothetical protein [Aerococcaceae bacterium NML191219]
MENLELVIQHLSVVQLQDLFDELRLKTTNIEDVHFFINDEDVYNIEDVNFQDYYAKGATGYLKIKRLYVGIYISDVVVIISGYNKCLEVTINFPAHPEYTDNIQEIIKWMTALKIADISQLFGYEPTTDKDQIIHQFKRE